MNPLSFREQLNRFINSEYKRLVAYTKGLLSDESAYNAEDFVQDVVVNLLERADITEPIENISGYIYRSVRNKTIDIFRKKKIKTVSLDQPLTNLKNLTLADIVSEAKDHSPKLSKEETAKRLYKILDLLNEDERALIIATELENQSFASLSLKSGIPINTLLSKKFRALQKVKKQFKNSKEDLVNAKNRS